MSDINLILSSYFPRLEMIARKLSKRNKDIDSRGDSLRGLQRGLTGRRELAGEDYFSRDDYLSIYLLYYWSVSWAQVWFALEELRLRGVLPRIASVLDIGSGPGPASFAAREFGAVRFRLVDGSAGALAAARELATSRGIVPADFLTEQRDLETGMELPKDTAYDLIVACHSMNELWKDDAGAVEKHARLLEEASRRLAPGGILLVVEPSAAVTCRPALMLRDALLSVRRENAAHAASVAHAALSTLAAPGQAVFECVAPCPGSYPCPALAAGENRVCHSTWAWNPPRQIAETAASAGLDRDSAKAAWFALRKSSMPEETGTGAGEPVHGRVVSDPMLNKAGRLRYIFCGSARLFPVSARKDDAAVGESGFFALGRGDLAELSELENRPAAGGYGFGSASRLKILMKAPSSAGEKGVSE